MKFKTLMSLILRSKWKVLERQICEVGNLQVEHNTKVIIDLSFSPNLLIGISKAPGDVTCENLFSPVAQAMSDPANSMNGFRIKQPSADTRMHNTLPALSHEGYGES